MATFRSGCHSVKKSTQLKTVLALEQFKVAIGYLLILELLWIVLYHAILLNQNSVCLSIKFLLNIIFH